jgi:hypothetical protein
MVFAFVRFTSHDSSIFNMRGMAVVVPNLGLMRLSLYFSYGVFCQRFTLNGITIEIIVDGARWVIIIEISVLIHGQNKLITLLLIRGFFSIIFRGLVVIVTILITVVRILLTSLILCLLLGHSLE